MLAPLATLIFLSILWLVARFVAVMIGESGSRVVAAFLGRSHCIETRIPAMRIRVSAPRPAHPMRAQQWRAAA